MKRYCSCGEVCTCEPAPEQKVSAEFDEETAKTAAYMRAHFGNGGPFDYVPSSKVVGYGLEMARWQFEKSRERIEKLEAAITAALEADNCYGGGTSCPAPMRSMCSNPSHKIMREALQGVPTPAQAPRDGE